MTVMARARQREAPSCPASSSHRCGGKHQTLSPSVVKVTKILSTVRNNPCAVLLIAQLIGIVVYPFLEGTHGNLVVDIGLPLFGMVVLVLALAVVRRTPSLTWLGVLIGIPTAVLTVLSVLIGSHPAVHFWFDAMHIAFYGYTFIGLLLYMFADEQVGADEIWAIGATFTVAVWLFAYIYSLCQTVVPGSFIAANDPGLPRTWMELLFLSCTTMTSTGLSDIVPVKPHARSLVMLQQIAGMLYLAVVVARIVGLTIRRRETAEG